jgi:hypothetical protein
MDVVIRNATMGNVCNVHWRCFRETHRLPPQRLNTGVVEVKLALEPTNVAGWIAKAIAIDPRASTMSYSSVISRRTLCITISPGVIPRYALNEEPRLHKRSAVDAPEVIWFNCGTPGWGTMIVPCTDPHVHPDLESGVLVLLPFTRNILAPGGMSA